MTKLEWCRENAPEALKNVPDEELLEVMKLAYERHGHKVVECEYINGMSIDLGEHEGLLDYMFYYLVLEFGDNLAFKGGYMLTKILNRGYSRRTEDIDFSVLTDEIYGNIKSKLIEVGNLLISKGIISRYELKDVIKQTMSGGIKFYDESGAYVFGVDVGWQDTTYAVTNYKIGNVECKGFKPERMVGDKLLSILSSKRFRRAKDLYDLFIISEECDLNLTLVHGCMRKRQDLDLLWNNWPFDDVVLREYEKAYNKLRISSPTGHILQTIGFNDAMERLSSIVECVKESTPDNMSKWDSKRRLVVKL